MARRLTNTELIAEYDKEIEYLKAKISDTEKFLKGRIGHYTRTNQLDFVSTLERALNEYLARENGEEPTPPNTPRCMCTARCAL